MRTLSFVFALGFLVMSTSCVSSKEELSPPFRLRGMFIKVTGPVFVDQYVTNVAFFEINSDSPIPPIKNPDDVRAHKNGVLMHSNKITLKQNTWGEGNIGRWDRPFPLFWTPEMEDEDVLMEHTKTEIIVGRDTVTLAFDKNLGPLGAIIRFKVSPGPMKKWVRVKGWIYTAFIFEYDPNAFIPIELECEVNKYHLFYQQSYTRSIKKFGILKPYL